MIERNNVKEFLSDLYELCQADFTNVVGNKATIEDVQDLYRERIMMLMDILGHESIYLDEK